MKFVNLIFIFFLVFQVVKSTEVPNVCGLQNSVNGYWRRSANGDLKYLTCQAKILSWSYDSARTKCVEFIYGGCGGNGNRFATKKDCESICITWNLTKGNIKFDYVYPPDPEVCGLQDSVGALFSEGGYTCGTGMQFIPLSWTFNSAENKCVSFMFRHCGSNGNVFKTKESCESLCINWNIARLLN